MSSAAGRALPRRGVVADLLPVTLVREVLLVGGYTLAIALSARLAFPLPGTPVPVSGQTFAVLFGAALLGARRAGLGSAIYLTLGLAGTPWFTATGGATLGYIVGFVAAALVVGRLAGSPAVRSIPGSVAVMALGNLVIYAFGVTYLAFFLGIGPGAAITLGAVPFLLGDAIKVAAAAALLLAASRAADHRR